MAFAVGWTVYSHRTQWARVAAKHGLRLWGFWFEGLRISGRLAGHRLELKKAGRLVATVTDVALPDLALRPQTVVESALQLATGTPDVQLGIRALDSAWLLQGPRAALLALLSPEVRNAAEEAKLEFTVIDGTLVARCPPVPAAASWVLDALALVLEQRTQDIPTLLLLRLDDPIEGVRHAAFDLLTSNAASPMAAQAAERALTSDDPGLQVAALRHLGMGAEPLAVALDATANPAARLEAIEQLRVARQPTYSAATILLSSAPPAMLRQLLAWLVTHNQVRHVPQILSLLRVSTDTTTQTHALRALGTLGGAEHASVLTPFMRAGPPSVRRAATAALDSLRSRHDLGDGGLSITSAATGQLSSPATASEGQVSVPTQRQRGLTEREP